MHGLAVGQKDNPKEPPLHLVNFRPKPDAAVSLDLPSLRRRNDTLNPFVSNYRTVGTHANCSKVLCNFHGTRVLVIPARFP
ncbi:MAG TPA: hypothetical protein VIF02_08230 [Methylocella sp.]|jgi:hypothetical protein